MSEAPAGSPNEIVLAGCGERFLAWLIDFIIVNVVLWAIFSAIAIPFWFAGAPERWLSGPEGPIGMGTHQLGLFRLLDIF